MAGTPERVWALARRRLAARIAGRRTRTRDAGRGDACGGAGRCHRGLGLALLGRKGQAEPLCARRSADQAVFPAAGNGGCGLRLRQPTVRHPLQAARRPARPITPMCDVYEVSGRGRRGDRPVPARQLRPRDQAQRRLDEYHRQPAPQRRGAVAGGAQQQQFREGRTGPADAAVARRRAHAVPRVRPRPARAAVECQLSAPVGHPGAARFRRTAVAAVSSTGRRSARCCAATRATGRPARRSPMR